MSTLKRIAFVMGLAVTTVINPGNISSDDVAAQVTTRALRPSTSSGGSTFSNLANAYDTNDATGSSALVLTQCSSDCTNLRTASATWLGIEDGHPPHTLEVHWFADAWVYATNAPSAGQIEVKIEYSLDSGSNWNTLESYLWTANAPACSNHGVTCSDHVSSLQLGDYQHTGAIQVRGYVGVKMTACWSCGIFGWDSVGGEVVVYDIRVIIDDCDIPTNESSSAQGWGSSYPFRTAHDFEQTLTSTNSVSFSGRTVTEADGGDTFDGCHYTGSQYDAVEEVTSGGTWTVNSSNVWGTSPDRDSVGWSEVQANYYQANSQNGLPCYLSGHQQMFMSCQGSYVPYIRNVLESGINTTSVSAQRQSNYQERSWP